MKVKKFILMMLLCTTSIILFSSCSGESETVEYWKVYIASMHGVGNYRTDYLQKRFDSMASNPDEYQRAYYAIADYATGGIYEVHDDAELQNKVKDVVERTNDGRMLISGSHYIGPRMTDKAMINMKSHPEMYIENACKIIGPLDDLKEEIASHVEVKKSEKVNVADFDCYNVLYGIDEKKYVICSITEKGNGQSEIQVITQSKSINEILDYWQALH